MGRARDGLLHEVCLLGATNVVISTNVPTRGDGLPYSDERRLDDPGVAVYFTFNKEQVVMCCPVWTADR
jgi:hypothetical protein